jgi:recombination protein RecT
MTVTKASPTKALAVSKGDDANIALAREMDKRMAVMDTSLAAGIDPQRLKNVALATFTKRPELWDCDPVSIARAIVECGQAGLEPTGLLGGAYLVPFFNSKSGRQEAQLIIGYRGLAMLAMRSGLLRRIEARVVHARDEFAYQFGIDPLLNHRPLLAPDAGNVTYAYAVAFYRDGDPQFDVMSHDEIEAIHRRSKSPDKGPWITDYEEMCKKTVLRRLAKLLPLTVEVARVLDEIDPETDHAATAAAAGRRVDRMSELRRTAQKQLGVPEADGTAIDAASVDVPDGEPVTVEGEVSEAPETVQSGMTLTDFMTLKGELGIQFGPDFTAAVEALTPGKPWPKYDDADRYALAVKLGMVE